MRYLLDTNMISDLVRNPQGKVAARIAHVGEESVCTSIIVAAELRYGAARKGSARLLAQLLTVLGALEILPFETPAENTDGDLRARLEAAGKPIGGNEYANRRSCGLAWPYDCHRQRARFFTGRWPSCSELVPALSWPHIESAGPVVSRSNTSPIHLDIPAPRCSRMSALSAVIAFLW